MKRTHASEGMRCRYQFFAIVFKEFAERNFVLQLLGVDLVCLIAASGNPGFVFRAFTRSVYCLVVFVIILLWYLHTFDIARSDLTTCTSGPLASAVVVIGICFFMLAFIVDRL